MKGCVSSHYFLPSFILFPTCPSATLDQFLLILIVRLISFHISLESIPSHPFFDLSTLELDVGTSIGLENNQIWCSYKEKENIEVSLQRCAVNREQLAACRVFHLPSKCSVFPMFHLLYTPLWYRGFLGTWHTYDCIYLEM